MDRKNVEIGDAYHQWTKYRRDKMVGGGLDWANQPSPYKEFAAPLKRIPIVSPSRKDGNPLWEAIAGRRSIRDFSHQPIALETFSRLIWATQGITARVHGFEFRATPSAGALYPIETYPVVNRVEGIPAGIYHYSVKESKILLIREGFFGHALSEAAR